MLGTSPYSFNRLVKEIDNIAANHGLEFFVQLGHSSHIPIHCPWERFLSRDQLLNKISAADLVISHGGVGSIHDALSCNKKIIAVPRSLEYCETQDSQEELVVELAKMEIIQGAFSIKELYPSILKCLQQEYKYYTNNKIPSIINSFLRIC